MSERRGVGKSKKYRQPAGRISENRVAWVRTCIGQFNIMRYGKNAEGQIEPENGAPKVEPEIGDDVFLLIPQAVGRPVMLNITSLTSDEFRKTRQIFNLLFNMAEPIIAERDKVAQDAFAKGDDSYSRVYRTVPEFVVRQGAFDSDGQGLRNRPESFASRGGDGLDRSGGDAGHGQQLADGQPEEAHAEDDPAASD